MTTTTIPTIMAWAMLLLVLGLTPPGATPYPNAAGGCSGINGSVDGPHLEGPVLRTGTLVDGSFAVELLAAGTVAAAATQASSNDTTTAGSVLLKDGGTTTVQAGTEYIVRLMAQGDVPFKGFLFRLAPKEGDAGVSLDTTSFLNPSDDEPNSQEAEVCLMIDIGGVTHANPINMTVMTSRLTVDHLTAAAGAATTLELQVTAVARNDDLANGTHRSMYYFDTYHLNVQGGEGSDATPAPAPAPGPSGTSGSASFLDTLPKLLASTGVGFWTLLWLY